MSNVRVRFAPSPTGPLHIGGVRTALYNYLLAKQANGTFVLRIEDTDQKRYVSGAEQYIIESLSWLGLIPQESPWHGGDYGPYRQSERKELYAKYIQELLDTGKAYRAFDTPEELDAMRERLSDSGVAAPKYDHQVRKEMRNSLTMSDQEVQELIDKKVPSVVRLKVDPGRVIEFDDLVRGTVSFQSDTLDDKVLMKADGLPTYHMANIVDDHLMKISHVIRGEEWLSSTAHHVLLYEAMGWLNGMPQFAHLPLILKPTGKGKLSKRDGQKLGIPVFPMNWEGEESYAGFKEKGFLPEAVLNFLALLGWNPGTEQELFTLEELIQTFSLEKVQKSGARFDFDKAKWFNQQHILQKSVDDLFDLIKPLQPENINIQDTYLREAIGLMKPRLETILDFWEDAAYLFARPTMVEEKPLRKKFKAENRLHFETLENKLKDSKFNSPADYSDTVKGYIQDHGLKFGDILPILRLALAGTLQGPDLFEMMNLLGANEVAARINLLLQKIDSHG